MKSACGTKRIDTPTSYVMLSSPVPASAPPETQERVVHYQVRGAMQERVDLPEETSVPVLLGELRFDREPQLFHAQLRPVPRAELAPQPLSLIAVDRLLVSWPWP